MTLAIHTDAPLMPLTQMVSGVAVIEVGKAAKGGPDCFYGWAEQQHPDGGCKDHHILWGMDDEETKWIGTTLATLGYQVVVTEPLDPDNQFGDHQVVITRNYDDAHAH